MLAVNAAGVVNGSFLAAHGGLASMAFLLSPWPLPGVEWTASRVRFQTANGEAADATISKIGYYVDFNNVPSGGETAFAYITCGTDSAPSWGCQFTLKQNTLQLQYLHLLTHLHAGNYDPNC